MESPQARHAWLSRLRLLPCLFALMVPVLSSAGGPAADMNLWRTEDSPRKDLIIEHYASDAGLHEIWLAPRRSPSDRVLLYTHGRRAEVLMSPDEQRLAINDFAGSDISDVHLFRRAQGGGFSEVRQAQIGQKSWRLFSRQRHLAKPPDYHHAYVEAVRWASNSKALLVAIWGYSDGKNYLDQWLCVFDTESLKASLTLTAMNRDAFRSESTKRKRVGVRKDP